MTIELMDGRTGEAHISSEDWATFNAATYGVTEGVFDWGDGFKLAMSTSNKGTLGAGAGLVDGKRVWVKTPESVTIESGGQGVKRHDVVGIQYETHSTNLESAVVKVVKGTPSASPADPDLPSKFLPLWRVPLDGLNVGAPVALFKELPTAAALRDAAEGAVKKTKVVKNNVTTRDGSTTVPLSWPVDVSRVVAVIPTYTCHEISDRIVVSDWSAEGITVRAGAAQSVDFSLFVLYV